MRSKIIGGQYRFTYPHYGTPEVHSDYRAHSGQIVVVIGIGRVPREKYNPGNGNQYHIQASDGWQGNAFGDELRRDKPRKARRIPEQKMLFIVCRLWLKSKNQPVQEFFTAHSTFDRATDQSDKLTEKFGPTFIIVNAPLDP